MKQEYQSSSKADATDDVVFHDGSLAMSQRKDDVSYDPAFRDGSRGILARKEWSKPAEFLLSVIGFTVDFENFWMFPYQMFRNGGVIFLVPFTLMYFLMGMPIFYMEMALGQYNRAGAITTWQRICPLAQGIGYTVVLLLFCVALCYSTFLSWTLYYLVASMRSLVPWASCVNEWNTPQCVQMSSVYTPLVDNFTMVLDNPMQPAIEYLERSVLQLHQSEGLLQLGGLVWELVVCHLIVCVVYFLTLFKGISISGKIIWFTALFPYVALLVWLIRGLSLPGAALGMKLYLQPEWLKIVDPHVWIAALRHVFFSLGSRIGVLMAFASYNHFHYNVFRDAFLSSAVHVMSSFLCGLVVFSVCGFVAYTLQIPITQLITAGPYLAFAAFPIAIAPLPGSTIWAVVYFLMLLTLGLPTMCGTFEGIMTALCDHFSVVKKHRSLFVGLLILLHFIISLMMCTKGGVYVITLFDVSIMYSLLATVLFEVLTVSWIYGADRLAEDCQMMLGFNPGSYWKHSCKFIAPALTLVLLIYSLVFAYPLQYNNYIYPRWANLVCGLLAIAPVLCIPGLAMYMMLITSGSWLQRWKHLVTPWKDTNQGRTEILQLQVHPEKYTEQSGME